MQLALSIPDAEVRKCSRCLDFREWDGGKRWLGRWCPECQRDYHRQYRATNADAIRERGRRYYAANPDAVRERKRRYYAANADARREYQRRYDAVNSDRIRERMRLYSAVHPEVGRNRRARKLNAVCPHGRGCFHRAIATLPQRCAVPGCRKRSNLHADHIIPLAGGGLDCKDNLQMLCAHHNRSKRSTDPIVWAQRNGRLL